MAGPQEGTQIPRGLVAGCSNGGLVLARLKAGHVETIAEYSSMARETSDIPARMHHRSARRTSSTYTHSASRHCEFEQESDAV